MLMKLIPAVCALLFAAAGCGKDEQAAEPVRPVAQKPQAAESHVLTVRAAVKDKSFFITTVLRNSGQEPLVLTFPTAQQLEAIVQAPDGRELYRSSKGKMFAQQITNVELKPGEVKSWEAVWTYNESPFVPGEVYKIRARLPLLEVNGQKPEAGAFAAETVYQMKAGAVSPSSFPIAVQVEGADGLYTVSGGPAAQAKAVYTVEDGHQKLVAETELDVSKAWNIQVRLPQAQLPQNGTLLFVLRLTDSSGATIAEKEFILQRFSS